MSCSRLLLAAAVFCAAVALPSSAEGNDDEVARMAAWYRPGHFDHSTFYLIASSHNDIAYLDDPRGTADFRSENLILPALELMRKDDTFALDIETTLYLKEFLDRHPERIDEVRQRVTEGRLSFGGRYTQYYEAVFGGEALARQMYFGRKWLKKTLGGTCDTHIVWDTDVPQRTLQSPQVFAKSGIKHLMIGRFPTPGIHVFESPDGSGVIFDTYLYSAGWGSIPGQAPPSPGTPTEKYVLDLLESQRPFFEEHGIPNFGTVTMSDYSCPGPDLIETVNAFNAKADAAERKTGVPLPRMKLATASTFLSTVEPAKASLPKYTQDWPSQWGYHHQPSHERLLTMAREGYNLLVNAERFALIARLLDPEDRPYPKQALTDGWEGLIYPDHGWCGERTLETIRIFAGRLQRAHDAGQSVYDASLDYIAGRVRRSKAHGLAVVVFNPLSWERTGPASLAIQFHRGEAKPSSLGLSDRAGLPVPCEWTAQSTYDDGTIREATLCFIAERVPSIGYTTYYISDAPPLRSARRSYLLRGRVLENRFYRLELGDHGIRSLVDKDAAEEVLDTGKFEANELFMLGVAAIPSPPFEYTFYPDTRRTETLQGLGRLPGGMRVESVRAGEVKTVISLRGESADLRAYQEITLYHSIKRLDLSTEIWWNGARKRELRLAFPIRRTAQPQVSYDVPFGVVEVGRNEMGSPMPREVQSFVDVSDGGLGVTLGVGATCLNDIRDITTDPVDGPMIQPVLLTTLLDLELPGQAEHPWWTQPGYHEYHYGLTTHPGTWRENWRFGWEFSNPLRPVLLRDEEDAGAEIDLYTDQDPPEKRRSAPRTHTYGSLPEELSFCSIAPANLVVSTLKQCEDDGSVVVRYFDMEGKGSEAELSFFTPVASVEQANLIEEEATPLPGHGNVLRLPSSPYSIDTVKLTMPVRRNPGPADLPFMDTMDYADPSAASAVWRKYQSFRALTLSADQNHTPGGGWSLATDGRGPFACLALPPDTNMAVEVWLYDSGDPDAFGGVVAAPDAPTDPTGDAEFAIFPSSLFGGHGGGSASYTFYTGTGDWARQGSGIPRAKGWHKVEMRFTEQGGSILFDGRLVASSATIRRPGRLYLGNPWAGSKPVYFDDVSVTRID